MAKETKAAKTAKRKTPPAGKSNGKKSCTVADCKRGYRAKGYCFFHYRKWRRGELPHARYKTCSAPECRKPAVLHGRCEAHAKGKGAAAAKPAAPAAAPAA